MKIEGLVHRGTATHTYHVYLTDAETSWPSQRIITAVDRHGNLSYDEWIEIKNGVKHPGHFGGTVNCLRGNLFEVSVYVD